MAEDTRLVPPHPMQPLVIDSGGAVRFRQNAIVRYLLDFCSSHVPGLRASLDGLALIPFPADDREQFAQLIGCSVRVYGDLSYVSAESVAAADEAAEAIKTGGQG